MDDWEKTANKVERIRHYLKGQFAGKTVGEARQCALIDDEISFGYLIKVEDAESSHSIFSVNEFLQDTAVNKISQIFEERHLSRTLKKAGGEIVRLKSDGFDIWKPCKTRRIA